MSSAAPSAAPEPAPSGGTPSGFQGFLTREVAGLPIFVWGGIVLIVGVGYIVLRRRGGSGGGGSPTSPADAAATPLVDPTTGLPYGNPWAGQQPPTFGPGGFDPFNNAELVNPDTGNSYARDQLTYESYLLQALQQIGQRLGITITSAGGTQTGTINPPKAPASAPQVTTAAVRLPLSATTAPQYPRPGSTVPSLAALLGTTPQRLLQLNPQLATTPYIPAGTQVRH